MTPENRPIDWYEDQLAFRPDRPHMLVDPLSKPGCPFPAVNHSIMVCPHCNPRSLTDNQRRRIEELIRKNGWTSL